MPTPTKVYHTKEKNLDCLVEGCSPNADGFMEHWRFKEATDEVGSPTDRRHSLQAQTLPGGLPGLLSQSIRFRQPVPLTFPSWSSSARIPNATASVKSLVLHWLPTQDHPDQVYVGPADFHGRVRQTGGSWKTGIVHTRLTYCTPSSEDGDRCEFRFSLNRCSNVDDFLATSQTLLGEYMGGEWLSQSSPPLYNIYISSLDDDLEEEEHLMPEPNGETFICRYTFYDFRSRPMDMGDRVQRRLPLPTAAA